MNDLRAQLQKEQDTRKASQRSAQEASTALTRINKVKQRQSVALSDRADSMEKQNKSLIKRVLGLEQLAGTQTQQLEEIGARCDQYSSDYMAMSQKVRARAYTYTHAHAHAQISDGWRAWT